MRQHRFTDYLTEAHGDGVANETAKNTEPDRLVGSNKLVLWRECLKDRGLPEGDRAVLLGVAEASVPIPKSLSSDRRARSIPGHATVDAWVCRTGRLLVTSSLEFLGPISPGAAWCGVLNTLEICCAQSRSSM